jgi:hypothetical protein
MMGCQMNTYRYASCDIRWINIGHGKGKWRAEMDKAFVAYAPSVTKMNRMLKAMKLAAQGPWA